MSDDAKRTETLATTLAQEVLPRLTTLAARSHLEVYLLASNLTNVLEAITGFLDNPTLSPSEEVHIIPNTALIKYSEVTGVPNLGPTIQVDTEFPAIGVARGHITDSSMNSVTVRLPFTDERLELLMHRKQDKFSKDEVNLLIIDLENIPHGYKRWPPLARRRLQPRMNRRFSGIVLFYHYFDLDTRMFLNTCHLEEHPNTYKRLPISLLNNLSTFSSTSI